MPANDQISRDDAPIATSKHARGKPGSNARDLLAQSVTINRRPDEVYAAFRDFAQLPQFMENILQIDVIDERRSHWVVRAPGDSTVEWDAIITDEVPGQSLTWQSEEGADVANSGRITFDDAGARGTVVTATIAYAPPAGMIGKLIAKIFQREPTIQTRCDLRRFKQFLETGEVATSARNFAIWAQEEKN